MLFSSIPFLYYFLPIVLIIYFAVPFRWKNAVLLLSSLYFYWYGEHMYTILMLVASLSAYVHGILIDKFRGKKLSKVFLCSSVVTSIALLGVFKYADFFIENINAVFGLRLGVLGLALPIGISFYTFQTLSYTIDVYRGQAGVQKSFIKLSTYVTLFPQLIAGPIVRYTTVEQELTEREHSFEKFSYGVRRFVVGLSKKVLIANVMGELCNVFRDCGEKTVLFYWVYAVAFSLHIYFDFSGYSDMAIGLGKMFGFNFLENFNYPYISKTISEFWRRWHMSLGTWFRDYVYIPLGGNRVKTPRWIFNILVVWFLTGFWHGAQWTFIVWGLYYAFFLLLERFVLGKVLKKLPKAVSHIYVVLVVATGFVIFNADNMTMALSDIGGMLGLAGVPFVNDLTLYYLASYGTVMAMGILGATPILKIVLEKAGENKTFSKVLNTVEPVVIICLLLCVTAYLVDGSFNPFLYFRF